MINLMTTITYTGNYENCRLCPLLNVKNAIYWCNFKIISSCMNAYGRLKQSEYRARVPT